MQFERSKTFDEVVTGRQLGRAVDEGHRRPHLDEGKCVEHRAVSTSDDHHRPTGELRKTGLDLVGHVTAARPLWGNSEFAPTRTGGYYDGPCSVSIVTDVDDPGGKVHLAHGLSELQAIPERRSMACQCADQVVVPFIRRHHIAHGVRNLLDLAAHSVRALEEEDIQLDVGALDGRTDSGGTRPDHDDVMRGRGAHGPRLRRCSRGALREPKGPSVRPTTGLLGCPRGGTVRIGGDVGPD